MQAAGAHAGNWKVKFASGKTWVFPGCVLTIVGSGGSGRLKVGEKVALSLDYLTKSDAKDGNLKPGQAGVHFRPFSLHRSDERTIFLVFQRQFGLAASGSANVAVVLPTLRWFCQRCGGSANVAVVCQRCGGFAKVAVVLPTLRWFCQ
jgi:hypothetical protein